jgi:3D (Asp-Asp-Asp) domain-containing protein
MRAIVVLACLTVFATSAEARGRHHHHHYHHHTYHSFAEGLGYGLHRMLGSLATYYGGSDGFCGKPTASGERYNCNGMTAAHRTLPLGSHVHVCGPHGCASLRINDRGPYANGASIDLSMAAAKVICGGLTSCHVNIARE